MGIAPNATIGQFTAAYAGALSSLGIECAPQMLHYSGEIIYSKETTGPDEPLLKIDGSRSTAARDEYVALSVPKEKIFAEPKDRDVSVLDPTSPFLSEIDRFDEILDSRKIGITQSFAGPNHQGHMVRKLSLRDILKELSDTGTSNEYREGVKDAAFGLATRANDNLLPGQCDELKAAELFFSAAVLFAGLADEKSMERAVEMFAHSAKYFYMTKTHRVAAAAVTEILAWLTKDDPKWREAYLVQAADRWEEAALELHGRGDVFAATIAVYRGLRAAALSKHYDAMRILFALSAEINGERKNTGEQTRDYLRSALATFNMYINGVHPDEKNVWIEVYWGLHIAFGLMDDQEMIDAIRPFLVAAKERANF